MRGSARRCCVGRRRSCSPTPGARRALAILAAPPARSSRLHLAPPPPRSEPLAVTAHTATTALGAGLDAQREAVRRGRSGLRRNDFGAAPRLDCWIGRVDGLEQAPLPATLADWESRNHRLAWRALHQDGFLDAATAAVARHGATRVAVLMGTSTSSIGETEAAYVQQQDGRFPEALARLLVHTPHALGDFVALATGARGPCMTVATACSSSAKVFALAARMLHAGIADAAIVGGVDTLCGSVLYGFNSLQLVSPDPCRPFDARRNGLSLGEAGGFALLEREPTTAARAWLRGHGESSDAHHMSAPHPQGLGARRAMADALARAGLDPAAIGYLNLHGTATPANDTVEAQAVAALFPDTLHASSTKGWTGHTLGAAGIVESVFALLALEDGLLPGTLNSDEPDPACGPQLRFATAQRTIDYAMNNAFGFGGNNCSLVFGRA
ncbi:MAG: beta-ketoacyl-[acyl-carrier-protein] synthase family protein [Pseudoxanthomonas sp.]|nr:beta-ketoacyl-[acyl-carrier-protein] synthase family protein [Pseudoxanthomonas sp.]